MNYPNSPINGSSQNSVSVESVESSVTKLVRNFNRRQRWKQLFFDPNEGQQQVQLMNVTPWRRSLTEFLESNRVRIISVILLVCDLALTVLDLSSSLHSCSAGKRDVRSSGEEEWFHWVGIAILGLLLTKLFGLLVGRGWSFFTRPGYVVDGSVLIGAIFMEVFLTGKGGGLLVVVSLWRVIRLLESAFELSDEAIEAQIERIQRQLDSLGEDNRRLQQTVSMKDEVIDKLQKEADQCRVNV